MSTANARRRTMADGAPGRDSIGRIRYSTKLAEVICSKIADGAKLVDICRDDGMPAYRTACHWRRTIPEFAGMYDVARHDRAERYADELVEIADDAKGDLKQGPSGAIVDHENIQRARLRVDTRKWVAARLLPRTYGDKVLHTGANGEGPVEVRALELDYSLLDVTELLELRRLLRKAQGAQSGDDDADGLG